MKDLWGLEEELAGLAQAGLLRRLLTLQAGQGPRVVADNRSLLNLCSNNYLGLCDDARIKEALCDAIGEWGLGAGASRLICGTMRLHEELESALADFKATEASLLFNSGYCANLGVIPALVGPADLVLADRLVHASLIDGILLSRARFLRFRHQDLEDLERLLKKGPGFRRRLIVTDGVFSMDGDIVRLPGLRELARRYECLLYCDEAHATGVIGETGRGTLEYYGIENAAEIIQMATLSKALGGLGAFVAGTKTLRDYLVQKARSFIYTTALPPAWCRVAMEALRILKTDPSLIGRLRRNIKIFRQGLQESGFQLLGDATPIIPVLTKEVAITMEFSRRLFKEGILAQGIRPPTVSRGQCRVRFTVMATHKEEELREALAVIVRVGRELGLSAKKRVKG